MMEALRNDGADETSRGASLRLVTPPTPRYAKYVRDRVADFVRGNGVAAPDAYEFLTALGEALANAIEHAKTHKKIETTCWIVNESQLIATVVDDGIGFTPADGLRDAAELTERGRGIAIMRQCTDHIAVRSAPGKGTAVILTRFLRHRHLGAVAGGASGG